MAKINHLGTLAATAGALVAVGLVVLMLVAAGGTAAGAAPKAAPKFQTITKTFTNTSAIAIPIQGKATPYPSEINVGGFNRGKIKDVNLSLKDFSHYNPEDVAVLLQGPKGQDAIVMSDVGGPGPDVYHITLVLDDEAASPLPDKAEVSSGTFKPTQGNVDSGKPRPSVFPGPAGFPPYAQALSVFDGTNPNGTWSLFVFDDSTSTGEQPNTQKFAGGWSIEIQAKVKK